MSWTESPPVDLPLSPDRERERRRRREKEYITIWQSQILHTNMGSGMCKSITSHTRQEMDCQLTCLASSGLSAIFF